MLVRKGRREGEHEHAMVKACVYRVYQVVETGGGGGGRSSGGCESEGEGAE